ncbi:hypothetical protein PRZ48_004137 [Zasmidium cellare]|uniref:Cytochrome P450 n=1 Tax=Zasmidium cellare TaxID=395010 RepID=A0ABR0EX33_ZASCE|nr:hypothetical protein PRZ48_004137 [Zasmidium cellare]
MKWYKEYGPIVGFTIMGQKQVLISDEKMLRDLFARRGDIYSDRGRVPAINIIARGVATFLLDKNDTWRRQRKAMGIAFSLADGGKFESFTDIESKYTLKDIVENPQDFDDHFARYAFSVVTRSSIGHFTRNIQDPYYLRVQQENAFIVNCFRPDKYLCNLAPFLLKLPEWLWKEGAVLNRFADNMWRTQLDEQAKMRQRMEDGTAPECFQTRFLANQHEWDLSDLEGVGIFSAFVGGGTRSPHNVMLSLTLCMLEHPDWLEKLQKHVDDVVGDRLPEFSDMPTLPMVRAAAMETLRYRTVHADISVPHKLAQDDIYEGYFFEKGTLVHANLGAMS